MSDRDLTPAQDESVRALLASAKHTEPAPPHVVARLDDALAALVAQRREERAPVVTLASRRRRVASTALLAAAAVVVFGVGITQVLPSANESAVDSSAGSSPASLEDPTLTQLDRTHDAQEPGSSESSAAGADQSQRSAQEKAPLSSADPDTGALTSTVALKPQVRGLFPSRVYDSTLADPTCPIPGAGSAARLAMTYDGLPGVLVYRVPVAGRQQVDLYLCGEGDPLRSVQIRVR